jgi:hypothetical protein
MRYTAYTTLRFIIIGVLVLNSILSSAQGQRIKDIDQLEQSEKENRLILLRKEPVYTSVPGRNMFKAAQYYYFDKMSRTLSLVAVYENEDDKHRGVQMFYLFQKNTLVKVRIIPPRYQCNRCKVEYYFDEDEVIHKNMEGITHEAAKELAVMAKELLAKMPRELAYGYFEWEK